MYLPQFNDAQRSRVFGHKRQWFVAVLTVFTFSLNAMAQKKPAAPPITLENALRRTLAYSPQLTAFEFTTQALDGEAQAASLKPAYTLGVELEDVFGTGEVSGVKEAEATLTLSSVIELGDKVAARTATVDARRSLVAAEKRAQTLDILGEVNRRYITVLTEQSNLALAQQALDLAQYAYQAVKKRVETGATPSFEQLRADAALSQARMDVLLVQKRVSQANTHLAIMWGETSPTFTAVAGDLFKIVETQTRERLLQVVSSSPFLEIYAEQSRIAQANLRLVKANNYVDVSWTAGIRRMQGIDETALVAGFSVPLFQKDRNKGLYNAKKARLEEIQQQRLSAQQSLLGQVNMLFYGREQAILEIETLEQYIIPPLQTALEQAKQAYENGRFSYLEWISIQQDLLNKHYALIQAASRVHLRTADIESLTGQSVQRFSSTTFSQ